MRSLLALSVITLGIALATAAKAQNYPWCAIYKGGATNCGFNTFQQCVATVSEAGFCIQNSSYQTSPAPYPLARVHRRYPCEAYAFRNSSGSFATLAAIRRASSRASSLGSTAGRARSRFVLQRSRSFFRL
jgi:hypothetical protein